MIRENSNKIMRLFLEGIAILAIIVGSVMGWAHKNSFENRNYSSMCEQQTVTKAMPLKTDAILNTNGVRTFDFILEDFRKVFNVYYSKDNFKQLLTPESNWVQSIDGQEESYTFKEDQENWRLPSLSIDLDHETKKVKRIMISFDDHSYSEESYSIYELYCFYAVKSLLPDVEENQIKKVCETLNDRACKNISDVPFDRMLRPDCIYYKENVAIYSYFAVGECLHLCIIPVDAQVCNEWDKEKVQQKVILPSK